MEKFHKDYSKGYFILLYNIIATLLFLVFVTIFNFATSDKLITKIITVVLVAILIFMVKSIIKDCFIYTPSKVKKILDNYTIKSVHRISFDDVTFKKLQVSFLVDENTSTFDFSNSNMVLKDIQRILSKSKDKKTLIVYEFLGDNNFICQNVPLKYVIK